jgi:hypothetical protein
MVGSFLVGGFYACNARVLVTPLCGLHLTAANRARIFRQYTCLS